MAEKNKGRYKAYGIISKEAGAYGIVLIDTVDWTEMNTNYVYEKWFYTGSSAGEPKMSWNKSRLYFTYPVPSISGYSIRTVQIDCGYDSGHMEFKELIPESFHNIKNAFHNNSYNNQPPLTDNINEIMPVNTGKFIKGDVYCEAGYLR